MRRVAPSLFTLGSALSLMLCVTTSVLWARSYSALDALTRERVAPQTGDVREERCMLARGRLTVSVSQLQRDVRRSAVGSQYGGWQLYRASYSGGTAPASPGPWLASWSTQTDESATAWGPGGYRSFTINLPVVIVLAAICPLVWLVLHLHRGRRLQRGLCVWCGYDLRASPGRCPECGSVSARQTA